MGRIALVVGLAVLGAVTGGLGLIPSFFGAALANGGIMAGILGGVLGAGVGNTVGNIVIPMHLPNQFGPRLGDLSVTSSTNGAPISIGYGTFRLAGNIIWSPGLVEHAKTTKHSAKGGPSYSSTDYTYTASFAIAFGESGGAGRTGIIKKIWADTKVVYDTTTGANLSKYAAPVRYTGSQTQLPDPTIQAAQGVANTPGYRGLIYAVFTDWLLSDFGNRIPNIGVQIDFDNGGSNTLDQRVTDICRRAGVPATDLDVSQLTGIEVLGYALGSMTDAKSALLPLMAANFVDATSSEYKLKFVPRGVNDPVLHVPESDIGLKKDKSKLVESFVQEDQLPREVDIMFIDPAISYEMNKAQKQRSSRVVQTKQLVTLQLPIVLTASQARQIAERTIYLAWLNGKPFNFNLWKAAYMVLDATDVITFDYEGQTYTMRINSQNTGADYTVALAGVSENSSAYDSSATGGAALGNPVQTSTPPADTVLYLYDLPFLQDLDAAADAKQTGFYWAVSSNAVWPGAVLNNSKDDANFNPIASSTQRTSYGVAQGILGDPPSDCWTWDTVNTLSVKMTYGQLAGSTDAEVLAGENALIIGNEVIQFVNAVQTASDTWTISRLLRGRRNTEYASTGHGAAEVVIDPLTGLQRSLAPLSAIGGLRYYRAVTVGQDLTTVASKTLTLAPNDLKPAEPVLIKGSRDGSNNLTIGWTRRTRYAGDWLNNTGLVPLNEVSEAYEIDILSGVTVLRTITWAGAYDGNGNPTVPYSAANQTTDGLTPGNPVSLKIYQLSGVVGRGFPGVKTI